MGWPAILQEPTDHLNQIARSPCYATPEIHFFQFLSSNSSQVEPKAFPFDVTGHQWTPQWLRSGRFDLHRLFVDEQVEQTAWKAAFDAMDKW